MLSMKNRTFDYEWSGAKRSLAERSEVLFECQGLEEVESRPAGRPSAKLDAYCGFRIGPIDLTFSQYFSESDKFLIYSSLVVVVCLLHTYFNSLIKKIDKFNQESFSISI